MRAADLAAPFPTVRFDTSAREAARLLAGQDLPGLIVVDERGRPATILAGTQVLRLALPSYCLDDPRLAAVIDEEAADVFLTGVGDRTVAEALPDEHRELAIVDADSTVLEVATLMATTAIPLVAVTRPGEDAMIGAITLDSLLDRLLATEQD